MMGWKGTVDTYVNEMERNDRVFCTLPNLASKYYVDIRTIQLLRKTFMIYSILLDNTQLMLLHIAPSDGHD